MTHGSFFTGTGLLDYGLMLAGLDEPEWVCEWDEWRREHVLARRFPRAVRHPDIRGVGAHNLKPVKCVVGGFPCKGASTAGSRTGMDHPETVLWREMARAIGELRPVYVVVENVANILALDDGAVWGEVLGDLAALGFDVVWDCLPAAAVGAPHLRDRVFAVATHADRYALRQQPEPKSRRGRAPVAGRPGAASADSTIVTEREPRHKAHTVAGGGEARPIAGQRDAASAPDPRQRGRLREQAKHGPESAESSAHAVRLGVSVEWGRYEAAVRRWEQVFRAAPEPLCAFRGVDARAAARVERSRLSALGDGVQVQCGQLAGAYVMQLERQRMELIAA